MRETNNISNSETDIKSYGLNGEHSDSSHKSEEKSKGSTSFECNICFENAYEPIVTRCGHLVSSLLPFLHDLICTSVLLELHLLLA